MGDDEDVARSNIAECWSRCGSQRGWERPRTAPRCIKRPWNALCQGADSFGDFYEFDCLEDVGEYTLAVHEGWRGSRCHSDGRHVCGCDDEDYCLPYDACCVEHEFDATGEVVSTTCHWDRGGTYDGGARRGEAATMSTVRQATPMLARGARLPRLLSGRLTLGAAARATGTPARSV